MQQVSWANHGLSLHETARTGRVLDPQRSCYKEVLDCWPLSVFPDSSPTPHLTAAEGGQRGKEDCRGHTACSGEAEEALQPPATLPCAAWENTLLAWQSLSLLSLWLQGSCPRRPNRVWGALPKRWVTHLSEARLAWGVADRFEREQFHVSSGWLAAQRWGSGKVMNKESTLTKDPAIEAQLKESKKTVFKHCPLIGEFF